MDNNVNEIWKDVPGYNGLYQYSSLERMRITDHYDAANRFFSGKIMKPHISGNTISYSLVKEKKI